MPKFNPEEYLSVEKYKEGLDILHAISGLILFEFAKENTGLKDVIIRNFISRADMMSRAIFELWELKDYQDCWIIHRCLLERLFHLRALQVANEFEAFEAWSFLQQINAVNRVCSDPEFKDALKSSYFSTTPEQKNRANLLKSHPPHWKRPKVEDVAKSMHMEFLYRFGYDFASTHIHPMANDGLQDFYTITGLLPKPNFPDQLVVLSNTLLINTMVVQEGLNSSSFAWRRIVFDFLDDIKRMLGNGSEDYKISFLKIGKMIEQGSRLCQPANKTNQI